MKRPIYLKKLAQLMLFFGMISFLLTCGSSKSTADSKEYVATGPMVSYEKDISPIMTRSCAPCHYPEEGKKLPLHTYNAAKEHVEDILARVQLPSDNWKYMPFKSKKPAFTVEEIDLVKRWVGQGFPK